MTRTGMGQSDAAGAEFERQRDRLHDGDVAHLSSPPRPTEVAATVLRALLIMSDAHLSQRAEMTLKLAGFRPIVAHDAATAMRWLDRDPDIGVVVIQGHANDFTPGDFISDVRHHAGRPLAAVLIVSDTLISVIRDIARLSGVEIVVHPSTDAELMAAVRNAAQWCDKSRHADALRNSTLDLLSAMQDQAGKLLGQMDEGALQRPAVQAVFVTPPLPKLDVEELQHVTESAHGHAINGAVVGSGMIKTLLRLQSLQQAAFGQGVIDVAAWVMLLDLLLSHVNGKRLGVTALCIGAGVPLTTALRRIDELIASGLAEKQADPLDKRRSFIAITEKGDECIRTYVEHLREELRMADKSWEGK